MAQLKVQMGSEGTVSPIRSSGKSRGPSQMSGRGREALPKIRVWLEDPVGGPGGVGRPTRRSERGRKAHPVVR